MFNHKTFKQCHRNGEIKFKKGTDFLKNVTAFDLDSNYGIDANILSGGKVADIQLWDYAFTGKFPKFS